MKIKTLFLASTFVLLGTAPVSAQSLEVPVNVSFQSKDDYTRYEKDVIALARWLETTPVSQEAQKRTLAYGFIIKWISGSPSVSIEINEFAGKLVKDNPELLAMFVVGYCRYALENNHSADMQKAYTAAAKSVINLYSLGGDFKKNKTLQKAIEKDKEGKLEGWIAENMKK